MKLSSLVCMATFAAVALTSLTTVTAQAQVPAFSFTPPPGGTSFSGNTTFGETFTVGTNAISVTSLGVWDDQQNGLAEAHPVTIWNGAGTALGSATVPLGTAGTLLGQYRYTNLLTPFTLTANTTYTIGAYFTTTGDGAPVLISPGNISSASGVTYGAPRNGIGNAFPTGNAFALGNILSANFQFTAAPATPEPGNVALFGALLMAGAGFVRRRRNGR